MRRKKIRKTCKNEECAYFKKILVTYSDTCECGHNLLPYSPNLHKSFKMISIFLLLGMGISYTVFNFLQPKENPQPTTTEMSENPVSDCDNIVAESEKIVNEAVKTIDEAAKIVDGAGKTIDEAAKIVDGAGKTVDEGEKIVDGAGKIIDIEAKIVDGAGKIIDIEDIKDEIIKLQNLVKQYNNEILAIVQGKKIDVDNIQDAQIKELRELVADLQVRLGKQLETASSTIERKINTLPDGTDLTEIKELIKSLEARVKRVEFERYIDTMIQQHQNKEIKKMLEELSAQVNTPTIVVNDLYKILFPVRTCVDQSSTSLVNVQNQKVPNEYKYWIAEASTPIPVTEQPFHIMRREVTVAEFECFFQSLSKERQEKVGKSWLKDDKYSPVTSISWEMALEYAEWLSTQTGHSWRLPTYKQWLASIVYFKPDTKQAVVRENSPRESNEIPIPIARKGTEKVVDLLGNVREWSLDACGENGHYVLGADYMVKYDMHIKDKRKPLCYTRDNSALGFRLVHPMESENEDTKLKENQPKNIRT